MLENMKKYVNAPENAEKLRHKLELQITQSNLQQNKKNNGFIDIPLNETSSITVHSERQSGKQLLGAIFKNDNVPTCNYFPSPAIRGNSQSSNSNEKPGKDIENVSMTETKDSITIGEELERSIDNEYEVSGAEFETDVVPPEPMTTDDCDADSAKSDTAEEDAAPGGCLTTVKALGAAWALDRLINRIVMINLLAVIQGDETPDPQDCADRDALNDSRNKTLVKAKGQKLRATVKAMLERTAEELRSTATYDTLRNANKSVFEKRQLIKEHSTNRDAVKDFWDAMWRHQNDFKKKKLLVDLKIRNLQKKNEQIKRHVDVQNERLLLWENARKLTNIELLEVEERRFQEKLQATEKKLIVENKGMVEARHIFSKIKELVNQLIQFWEEKHKNDVGDISADILELETREEELDDSYKKLQEKEEDIQTLISEFEERKRIYERKTFLNNMASKIQAFWKGTMVRKFLGPYEILKKLHETKEKNTRKKKKNKKKK